MAHDKAGMFGEDEGAPTLEAGARIAGLEPAPADAICRNHRFRAGLTAIGMLVVNFLSGCASNPPSTGSGAYGTSAAPRPSFYRDKAPYNRPYTVRGKRYYPLPTARGYRERGVASWYGWESGNQTAMGSHFNPRALTAAHKTLPLPTRVKVTNIRNGRSVVVLINDRGPFVKNRLIDLSQGAARAIGIRGLGRVLVESLDGEEAPVSRRPRFNAGPLITDTRDE